jgi:uncharacterized membrane protein YphA (DoxX/SURF4 family)
VFHSVLALLCRLVVGGVWIAAGVLKIPDPAESIRAVRNYRLLPEAVVPLIGTGLPVVEVALGLLLIAGVATRVSAMLSAVLLLLFVIGISSAWARGLDIDCGCFGGGGGEEGGATTYGWDIARDLSLLAASVYLAVRGPGVFALDRWRSAAPRGRAPRSGES